MCWWQETVSQSIIDVPIPWPAVTLALSPHPSPVIWHSFRLLSSFSPLYKLCNVLTRFFRLMKIRYFIPTIHNSVLVMVFVLLTHWHIFPAIRWWWWRYSLWLESVPFGPPCPALLGSVGVFIVIFQGGTVLALMCRNECIPICRQIAGHRSHQTLCSRATPPSGGECVDIFRYIYHLPPTARFMVPLISQLNLRDFHGNSNI